MYSALCNVDVVGVADSAHAHVTALAEQYHTRPSTDYHVLLGVVDVVSITGSTAPPSSVARDFLEAGVHVLLEPALPPTMAEARELMHLAEARGVVLHMGHVERFDGAIQELQQIVCDPWFIDSRRLGPFMPRVQDAPSLSL